MKSQLRHLVAQALYPTKAYSMPAVCERYGLESGTGDEAFSSKKQYVMKRLEKLSDEKVFKIAKASLRIFRTISCKQRSRSSRRKDISYPTSRGIILRKRSTNGRWQASVIS